MNMEELSNVINQINRKHGSEVIRSASGFSPERLPTGSLSLDIALNGGWPMGRIALVWGNRSSTKSTLTLWAIANAQAQGKKCMYIDAEKTFDSKWAEKNGVKTDDLLLVKKSSLEDILEITKEVLQKSLVDVIVLDSTDGVNSSKFLDDDSHAIGIHARAMSELLTKWNSWNENTLIVMIAQVRTKMAGTYAYQEYSGGQAMDFYPSVILQLLSSRDPDTLVVEKYTNNGKVYEKVVAQQIKWRITKSKVADPHQEGSYTFNKSGGPDEIDEIVQMGVKFSVLNKSGAWYYIGDEKFQGAAAVKEYLRENPELVSRLKDEILEATR